MKLTRHNGRAGKNGVYNPKHNDRSFDIANSEHIDEERAKQNLYWDCYNGFRNFKNPDKENELSATFEDVEQLFYRQRYRDFVTGQNERNVKNRHPERNKETGDLLKSKKTCPEETVYQIGTLDNHVPPELLIEIVTEFMEIVNERFGSHVHILNWALHLDESTPHIHERHVFDCENQYGEIAPQQEKALEALGFELPEPEKPVGRKNNRKMTFDAEAIASEEEPYERFFVIDVDRGSKIAYAIWDDQTGDYYVDEDGVTEEFDSEFLTDTNRRRTAVKPMAVFLFRQVFKKSLSREYNRSGRQIRKDVVQYFCL